MSIQYEDEFENNAESLPNKEASPQETISVKLDRRRKIEALYEERRLKEELSEYDNY